MLAFVLTAVMCFQGTFGARIAEDALEQYIAIQTAIIRDDEVPSSDMFLLLDSIRRSHRRKDELETADTPPDTEDPDQVAAECEPDYGPTEERGGSSPGSGDGTGFNSDTADSPAPPPEKSAADKDPDLEPESEPGTKSDPEPEPEPVRRRLVLLPEEVLFLSHALGCVRVTTADGAELACERLYRHLSEDCGDRHLAARYAAYLELRDEAGWCGMDCSPGLTLVSADNSGVW